MTPGSKARWLASLTTGVLVVFYAFLCFGEGALPRTAFFGGDSWDYPSLAVNLASGHGLRFGGVLPFDRYGFGPPDARLLAEFQEAGRQGGVVNVCRTPGYPVFLAGVYAVFGVRPAAAMAVQTGLLVVLAALMPLLFGSIWSSSNWRRPLPIPASSPPGSSSFSPGRSAWSCVSQKAASENPPRSPFAKGG